MGFFDFLKDVDIKAPEPEPQRGMKFSSTDEKGSIATSPDGRILSNVEKEAFSTRDQRRPSADLASFSAGSPPPDINIRPRGGIRDVMGGFRQGDVTINQATGLDLFRNMDAQRARDFEKRNVLTPATPPSELELFKMTQDYNRAFLPPDINQAFSSLENPRQEKIYGLVTKFLKDDPELAENYPDNALELLKFATDQVNREEYLANLQAYSPRGENKLSTTSGFEQPYSSDFDQDPQFPQSALFGARATVPTDMFLEKGSDRSSADLSQLRSKTGGISTFADAKKEIQEGKEGGIKDLNFLQKGMALIRNPVGRMLGYETDDQGRLTMKGIADMEADKQRSQAIYEEGQRQRNLDRDRAMRMAQTQQQPVSQPPVQEEGIKNLFERNPESLQAYLNRFRPPNITGNVPLTMYGQVGGEYDFFKRPTNVPFMAEGGQALQKQPTGEVVGAGGPKDDLVGPILLSNKEYVLPHEQIKMYGGGNYETGVKRLEQDRMNALTNFA